MEVDTGGGNGGEGVRGGGEGGFEAFRGQAFGELEEWVYVALCWIGEYQDMAPLLLHFFFLFFSLSLPISTFFSQERMQEFILALLDISLQIYWTIATMYFTTEFL